ncbi:MAG: cobalamin biosynthesis protein [Chloroflexi bacterium]|nr:cobalamin biosynthesis protein [Chloroflexota bacterium]
MRSIILLLAVAIDRQFGDPPNALHPVAWFGRLANAMVRCVSRRDPRTEFAYGVGIITAVVAAAVLPALVLERGMRSRGLLRVVALGVALKTTFAWRGLIQAGDRVRVDLEAAKLDAARYELRALVSRDTAQLGPPFLASAAVESLAENASDSFVAPLFYFTFFGLPGAFAYRAVNTLDAMIGYHGRFEYIGKPAARLDDVLNWIPARITALLIVLSARLAGGDSGWALRAMKRDHARTESPNAGYPMSAMAGALGVRLEKIGHYRLNPGGRAPVACDVERAARIASIALGLGVAASVSAVQLKRKP